MMLKIIRLAIFNHKRMRHLSDHPKSGTTGTFRFSVLIVKNFLFPVRLLRYSITVIVTYNT